MSQIRFPGKGKILSFIVILFFWIGGMAQNGITETEKLESLCRVWGYLKYYHPEVSKGKFDWDAQLLHKIPEVIQSSSREELSRLYKNWITGLGKIKMKSNPSDAPAYEFNHNFDLSWIDNPYFTEDLKQLLRKIETHRNRGKKYYVGQKSNIGNAIIKNEKVHENFEVGDYGQRLIMLFRYWNVVEYFFPAKYQMDQDWDVVLGEMIEKLKGINTTQEYHLFIRELISKIDDGHANFSSNHTNSFFGYYWPSFRVKAVDGNMVISDFYNHGLGKRDGLALGDIVTRINGKEISEILKERLKYVPASNIAVKYRDMSYAIFNGDTKNVTIEINRNGKLIRKEISRYEFRDFGYEPQGNNPKKWEILDRNIGYVNLGAITYREIDGLMTSLWDTKAIILDLRNGVNELWGGIGKYIKTKRSPFAKILRPDLTYPGNYIFKETKNCCKENSKVYKGKIILLVNEDVQSHGEFTCMVWQTGDNVVTIGSQTAGADGQVSSIPLGNNLNTRITGVGIFYPDGTATQRKGVKIDVVVNPTLEGIKSNRDGILEKAIKYVSEQ